MTIVTAGRHSLFPSITFFIDNQRIYFSVVGCTNTFNSGRIGIIILSRGIFMLQILRKKIQKSHTLFFIKDMQVHLRRKTYHNEIGGNYKN